MPGELVGVKEWNALLADLGNVDALVSDYMSTVEAPRLFTALHAAGSSYGRMGARAAGTLQQHALSDGAAISAGGGGGLGAVLFAGTEYGGQKRRKTYSSKSPRGKAFIIKQRRTTMMFGPHIAAGYWFWPTVRSQTKGIVGRCRDVIVKEVGGG